MRYYSTMYDLLKATEHLNERRPEALFEAYCESFFNPDDRELSFNMRRAAFKQACDDLCRIGWYDAVLRFIHPVFMRRDDYDPTELGRLLDLVQLTDRYTLRNLCSDYYIEYSVCEATRYGKDADDAPSGDLFDKDNLLPETNYRGDTIEPSVKTVFSKLLGLDLDIDKLTKEDIDLIASKLRELSLAEYERETEEKLQRRAEQEENEEQYGKSIIGKEVILPLSDDRRDEKLPGGFCPLFSYLERSGQDELCYYILSEYVLPYLTKYGWNDADKRSGYFAIMLRSYAVFIQSLFLHFNAPLYYANTARSEEQLYKNVTEEPKAEFVAYAANIKVALSLWATLLHQSADILIPFIGDSMFSFHIAACSYLLCLAGESNKSIDLLINHYSDIKSLHTCLHFSLIALIRNILSCDDLAAVNTLYGFFCSSEAIYERERRLMRAHLQSIITFMNDVRAYIKENDQIDVVTNKSIYDFLYSDDRVSGITDRLTDCYENDRVPDLALSQELSNALIGFKGDFGIDLGRFADRNDPIERLHTGDTPLQYIYGGLSDSLRLTADRLYKQTDIFSLFRRLLSIENFRRGCDVLIQNRLIELRRTAIVTKARDLALVRASALPDDVITGTIIAETEKLAALLRPDGYDRIITERLVRESQEKFCSRFYSDRSKNLLGVLSVEDRNELWGYLVTSEMIFRYLDEQNDETLDYTPALISLTKALEFVLFAAYKKLCVSDTAEVEPQILSRNFAQNNSGGYEKLSRLELGNLIYLLKDGKHIFLDKAAATVKYPANGLYPTSHFKKWNCGVFDMAMLSRFAELDITVSDHPDKTLPFTVHFSAGENAEDQNRATLVKALEYIKDNYRNPAAHKDRMGRSAVTACRELMLSSEQLLWILLAIIDFSKPDIA